MVLTLEEKRRAVFALNSIMNLRNIACMLQYEERVLIIDFLTERQEEYGDIDSD